MLVVLRYHDVVKLLTRAAVTEPRSAPKPRMVPKGGPSRGRWSTACLVYMCILFRAMAVRSDGESLATTPLWRPGHVSRGGIGVEQPLPAAELAVLVFPIPHAELPPMWRIQPNTVSRAAGDGEGAGTFTLEHVVSHATQQLSHHVAMPEQALRAPVHDAVRRGLAASRALLHSVHPILQPWGFACPSSSSQADAALERLCRRFSTSTVTTAPHELITVVAGCQEAVRHLLTTTAAAVVVSHDTSLAYAVDGVERTLRVGVGASPAAVTRRACAMHHLQPRDCDALEAALTARARRKETALQHAMGTFRQDTVRRPHPPTHFTWSYLRVPRLAHNGSCCASPIRCDARQRVLCGVWDVSTGSPELARVLRDAALSNSDPPNVDADVSDMEAAHMLHVASLLDPCGPEALLSEMIRVQEESTHGHSGPLSTHTLDVTRAVVGVLGALRSHSWNMAAGKHCASGHNVKAGPPRSSELTPAGHHPNLLAPSDLWVLLEQDSRHGNPPSCDPSAEVGADGAAQAAAVDALARGVQCAEVLSEHSKLSWPGGGISGLTHTSQNRALTNVWREARQWFRLAVWLDGTSWRAQLEWARLLMWNTENAQDALRHLHSAMVLLEASPSEAVAGACVRVLVPQGGVSRVMWCG